MWLLLNCQRPVRPYFDLVAPGPIQRPFRQELSAQQEVTKVIIDIVNNSSFASSRRY